MVSDSVTSTARMLADDLKINPAGMVWLLFSISLGPLGVSIILSFPLLIWLQDMTELAIILDKSLAIAIWTLACHAFAAWAAVASFKSAMPKTYSSVGVETCSV